jgi:hypothetical protein
MQKLKHILINICNICNLCNKNPNTIKDQLDTCYKLAIQVRYNLLQLIAQD